MNILECYCNEKRNFYPSFSQHFITEAFESYHRQQNSMTKTHFLKKEDIKSNVIIHTNLYEDPNTTVTLEIEIPKIKNAFKKRNCF